MHAVINIVTSSKSVQKELPPILLSGLRELT